MLNKTGLIEKGWGYEDIWVSTDDYCSKFMHFNQGAEFSMHFHDEKVESWYVMGGEFKLLIINTQNAERSEMTMRKGDTWTNERLVPHKLICLEAGSVLEVSTPDHKEDNYRVGRGDSQK